jgi:hypothetical protein
MAKKVAFTPDDMVNNDTGANPEMLAAMERARNEMSGGLDLKAPSTNNGDSSSTTTKKRSTSKKNNTPTKKDGSLSSREIITQKEKANPSPLYMSDRHEVVTDMKVKINELLPNMNIDLNNIVISDSLNSLEKHTNLDLVFNSKPTFQVALPQSCYTVYMEALKYQDIDAITTSTMDEYHTTLKMYQIIHSRMQATSIGAISFDTFCECTSFFDLQNLFYGLHMQTFPGTTNFDFKCIHCQHSFSQAIPNDSLVFSKDTKIFERLEEVAKNADTPDKVKAGSLIAEHKRICLDQSKTIIDIRIPSLKDQLNILKSTPADKMEEMADDLATLLFIKNVLILNVPETIAKNSPVYYPVTAQNQVINVLKELSINDTKQLAKAIDEWTDKYKTEYRIPSFKCPSCKKELGNMPVDMENVLFRLMLSQ